MPAGIWLNKFGVIVTDYFGHTPYHVGSSLRTKEWRDVDVRLILPDDEFEQRFGKVQSAEVNTKLAAVTLAFAALGTAMTVNHWWILVSLSFSMDGGLRICHSPSSFFCAAGAAAAPSGDVSTVPSAPAPGLVTLSQPEMAL